MAKEFKSEIMEVLGVVKEANKGWGKYIMKIRYGEDTAPISLDIRNYNLEDERSGKGITLNDEEADAVVDILLDHNYGSIEKIREALERREESFKISEEDIEKYFDDPIEEN